MQLVIGLVAGALAGASAVFVWARIQASQVTAGAKGEARALLDRAKSEADAVTRDAALKAKEEILRVREQVEDERKRGRAETAREEERLQKREENIERKNDLLTARDAELGKREQAFKEREAKIADKEKSVQRIVEDQQRALERVASMSVQEAKERLMQQFVEETKQMAAREAQQIEDLARDEAEKRAKRIIGIAIQRYAGEHVQERAVTSVHLPSDDVKGKIIGREGRNIRALEAATGVDLIIDDTPGTVVLSSFDPIRREVARVALERLLQDGRIHPARIEEVVERAREEVDKLAKEAGDQALSELGITRVHPEIVRLLGRLRYRYSYAQNVLRHSVEAGYLCGLMAAELGLNVKQARRAGLLHDIGKAVSHEVEGPHAVVGGQLARKYGEDPVVSNAIAAHHEEEAPESVLAHLTAACDALSGARPGARREMLESYVKRLEDLEKICSSFQGVDKSYAIQAGREVRVLVQPDGVSDMQAAALARDIARRIEGEIAYPGQIKVTVIRETRSVDYAK